MKVVHIGWYNPQPTGGVGKAILEQTKELHRLGLSVEIWTFSSLVDEPTKSECSAPFDVWLIPMLESNLNRCFSFHKASKAWIKERLPEVHLFHIHSVFIPENALVARLGKPYVVTPHGGWSKPVMEGKRKWLKRLWVVFREARMWRDADLIQAVSKVEGMELKQLTGNPKIRYIPNGVEIPDRCASDTDRDILLFIGRMDINQKGLDLLLESIRIAKVRGAKIPKLILAGPDYRGGRGFIETYLKDHNLSDMIEIRGAVHGAEKEALFLRAILFLHTSRWEGLPLVLLEALAYGIPCLLTPGTNVAGEWEKAGCAFKTDADPERIAEMLISLSYRKLDDERLAARALAASEYSWVRISEDLREMYYTCLSAG